MIVVIATLMRPVTVSIIQTEDAYEQSCVQSCWCAGPNSLTDMELNSYSNARIRSVAKRPWSVIRGCPLWRS